MMTSKRDVTSLLSLIFLLKGYQTLCFTLSFMFYPFPLQKVPPMDEILAGMNGTITDVELVSSDTRKAINDTYTSGVQEIEFFKYSIEVKIERIFERNFAGFHEISLECFAEAKRNFPKLIIPPSLGAIFTGKKYLNAA